MSDEGKVYAIVAYITLIGWIVALVLNMQKKDAFASFHIRQMLIIMLTGFVCGLIPILNLILWIFPVILWIMGLVYAIQGKKTLVPVVGKWGQDWFKAL